MSATRWVGIVLAALLALAGAARADDELTEEQRSALEKQVVDLHGEAFRQYQRGAYEKSMELLQEAQGVNQRLYPKDRYPDGHKLLADGINNMAFLLEARGEYARAEPLFREALQMFRRLYPGEKFPDGHHNLAVSINNMGGLLMAMGEFARAEPFLRESLEMKRRLYPREKFPDGHADLALSLSNMGTLVEWRGEYAQAEPFLVESVEMLRKLYPRDKYPDGDEQLARSLGNLGGLLEKRSESARAESFLRESVTMRRRLYPKEKFPNGHPDLAAGFNSLGSVLRTRGEYAEAEFFYKEAEATNARLYPKEKFPNGHPHIAASLHNRGSLYWDKGEYAEAELLFRDALKMHRQIYSREKFPDGHPDMAANLNSLGCLLLARERYAEARPVFQDALVMRQRLALCQADLASEAEALNYVATLPLSRDTFLSATRHLPADPSAYDLLWDSRAALTRLLERRHRDLLASRDDQARDLGRQLVEARQRLAYLLLHPAREPEEHRKEVQRRTEAKEDLERRLARQLRLAPRADPAPATVKRLCELLPEGSAFVDLLRYLDLEYDRESRGDKGKKVTPRYVAFVLRRGQPPARVELNEAAPVDAAWAAWHKAITSARPDEKAEREAAAAFADLVWRPLRDALPAGLRTVYLAPEGRLNQVPWAALPGRKPDSVLLDEQAICLVPHGPFLLERLEAEPVPSPLGDTLVAYGGVDYAAAPEAVAKGDDLRAPLLARKRVVWPDLPGTAREQAQLAELAKKALKDRPVARSGRVATTAQLLADLPKARYAHLATHGFFADPQFRSALQLDPQLFEYAGRQDRRGGARSPLVLSGLVLAGANREGGEAAPDRGILTAEGLVGLPLEHLELAVLSACETGLGGNGGEEGVYGLQRAFHVAGCRGVVASLWKVDDGATQALMALFYRNLWERKLDPAEALRRAQLTLYRHPEAAQVARKRGADFSESDLPKAEDKPAQKPEHSPPAHWAAFTFSGVRPAEAEPAR